MSSGRTASGVRSRREMWSRTAPGGVDGIVDLYEMPAYEDITTLLHRDGRWHIWNARASGPNEARPLTRARLRDALAELTSHAR